MADGRREKSYAPLSPPAIRERVRDALISDAGYTAWATPATAVPVADARKPNAPGADGPRSRVAVWSSKAGTRDRFAQGKLQAESETGPGVVVE
jgi:hypothetical protein